MGNTLLLDKALSNVIIIQNEKLEQMNYANTKVVLVPIDNRPVTYLLPQLVGHVAGVEMLLPPREFMGSLQAPTDLDQLNHWLTQVLPEVRPSALFVCLDSLLYGGLIPSRRSTYTLSEILHRAKNVAGWKKLAGRDLKIFAQSSIMRIPNYDDATEEPEYWNEYGKKIHKWSTLQHKQSLGLLDSAAELYETEASIPPAVRKDFLKRRARNLHINEELIHMAQLGQIDYLVFSQDDTGEFGLNVMEKQELVAQAKKAKVLNISAYAGADEVILTLLTRWLAGCKQQTPRISIQFSPEEGKNIRSNFEGQTIGESLIAQANAAGLEVVSGNEDFMVIVHTSGTVQGDHMWLPNDPDLRFLKTQPAVDGTIRLLEESKIPVVLCDVAYSNGSDPLLIEELLKRKDLIKKLWAYAGWNTTGNTVGSALALGTANWFAKQQGSSTTDIFKKAMFVRLADDWAYQTQVRPHLNGNPSEKRLQQLMTPLLERVGTALEYKPDHVNLKFPWQRTFEVEISFDH